MIVSDWSGALSLTERRDLLSAPPPTRRETPLDADELVGRHQRWANRPVHASVEDLEQRLAVDGISLAEFDALAEGVVVPGGALRKWPWLAHLEAVCEDWVRLQALAGASDGDSQVDQALASVLDPFRVALARDLRADLHRLRGDDPHGVLADDGLLTELLRGFVERARGYAHAPAAVELHWILEQHDLEESELPRAGAMFLERMRGEDGPAFLAEYPVMARCLAELALQHRRNAVELAQRVLDDAALLEEAFAAGGRLGRLVEVGRPSGDFHRDGRVVRVLRFSGGVRVVFKPRSLAIDVFVADFMRWLNSKGIEATQRPVLAVDRGTYGWTELVEHVPCTSLDQVERFYRRQGGLVAACHALSARDLHSENVIAEGEYPVVVDLEVFFQPPLPRQHGEPPFVGGPIEVLRSRLLPQGMDVIAGQLTRVDRSGIAGAGGAMPVTATRLSSPEEGLRFTKVQMHAEEARNQPVLAGERVPAAGYAGAVEAGFREVAEAIRAGAGEVTGPGGLLERAAGIPIRVLLRPTLFYSRVMGSARYPRVLRDGLDRERVIDVLWPGDDLPPTYRAVFPFERRDLLRADVPLFFMAADGLEIMASEGEGTGVLVSRSGLSVARERIDGFTPEVVEDLSWAVRASLAATAQPGGKPRPSPLVSRVLDGRPVPAEALRQRAVGLAALIASRVERGPDGTTWGGFASVPGQGWVFGPLYNDLYHGLAGVVLFLAYAGACTKEDLFQRLAREGSDTIRRVWERRKANPSGPECLGTSVGGAFAEAGGAALLLAHLSVLWGRDDLAREALELCELIGGRLDEVKDSDITGGVAGTLAVVLTLQQVLADDRLLRLAERCGDLLAKRVEPQPAGVGWPDGAGAYRTGFAHGTAGIAASLARLGRATGDRRWTDLAADAREYQASLYSAEHGNWLDVPGSLSGGEVAGVNPVAWCVGAAGVGLGSAIMLDGSDEGPVQDLRRAVRTMAGTLVHRNHSVCHGSFGKLLVLRRCEQALAGVTGEVAGEGLRRLVPATLDTVDQHGFVYPLPDQQFTPGFMCGAAGVGYTLLALADPSLPTIVGLDDLPA